MELEGLGDALAKIGRVKETLANKNNSPLEIGITKAANLVVQQFQLSLANSGVEPGSSLYSSIYATQAVLINNGVEISIKASFVRIQARWLYSLGCFLQPFKLEFIDFKHFFTSILFVLILL